MKILIPNYKCISVNSYFSSHWTHKAKITKTEQELAYYTILNTKNKDIEKFKECNIFFEIEFKSKNRRDPDNCLIKNFLDGIVKAGIIPDDNSKYVKEITIRCLTGQEEDKIIIHITGTDL